MIAEANRIIKENMPQDAGGRGGKKLSASVSAAIVLISLAVLALSVGFLIRSF